MLCRAGRSPDFCTNVCRQFGSIRLQQLLLFQHGFFLLRNALFHFGLLRLVFRHLDVQLSNAVLVSEQRIVLNCFREVELGDLVRRVLDLALFTFQLCSELLYLLHSAFAEAIELISLCAQAIQSLVRPLIRRLKTFLLIRIGLGLHGILPSRLLEF